jgi:hypothetical protein
MEFDHYFGFLWVLPLKVGFHTHFALTRDIKLYSAVRYSFVLSHTSIVALQMNMRNVTSTERPLRNSLDTVVRQILVLSCSVY